MMKGSAWMRQATRSCGPSD